MSMKWWKPIETGGSLACLDCPNNYKRNDLVKQWKGIADLLVSDDEVTRNIGKALYEKAVRGD